MMKMKITDQKQNLHQQLQAQGASKIGGGAPLSGLQKRQSAMGMPNLNAPQDL